MNISSAGFQAWFDRFFFGIFIDPKADDLETYFLRLYLLHGQDLAKFNPGDMAVIKTFLDSCAIPINISKDPQFIFENRLGLVEAKIQAKESSLPLIVARGALGVTLPEFYHPPKYPPRLSNVSVPIHPSIITILNYPTSISVDTALKIMQQNAIRLDPRDIEVINY